MPKGKEGKANRKMEKQIANGIMRHANVKVTDTIGVGQLRKYTDLPKYKSLLESMKVDVIKAKEERQAVSEHRDRLFLSHPYLYDYLCQPLYDINSFIRFAEYMIGSVKTTRDEYEEAFNKVVKFPYRIQERTCYEISDDFETTMVPLWEQYQILKEVAQVT
ncbi:hypothetical protein K491DRAFT_712282 [Lophiostoma macrostomum CBS 122681]|uniref:Uncharacterized protein n=1 Tax=Lophiostoma macrostomum CBS 122681 TaxID=1314788 RepID=A0A6A6TMC0_9PLEO|nr:hypothetical protein K491DRAFT_712282 [Lophiostoma macrostomum CBS 122681]